jgi:hypothetical protein
MKVTGKILDMIRQEIESIDYGTVSITVNEKGNYAEIHTERRTRVVKELGDEDKIIRGVEKVYREDKERPDPIPIN